MKTRHILLILACYPFLVFIPACSSKLHHFRKEAIQIKNNANSKNSANSVSSFESFYSFDNVLDTMPNIGQYIQTSKKKQ